MALTDLQYNCLEVAIDHLIEHLKDVSSTKHNNRNVDVELEATKCLKNSLRMMNNDFGIKS